MSVEALNFNLYLLIRNFLNNNLLDLAILKNMGILWTPNFDPTNNFIRILSFNYSFVVLIVDVSFYNSHKFF